MTHKAELFFVRILLPFVIGIIITYGVESPIVATILVVTTWTLFGILMWANLTERKYALSRFRGIAGLLAYVFWLALGCQVTILERSAIVDDDLKLAKNDVLRVWVASEPQVKNGILRMEVVVNAKIENAKIVKQLTGKIMVILKLDPKRSIELNFGDNCLISGMITKVVPPQNPGEFDFRSWLATKNIYHQIFINQHEIFKFPKSHGNPIVRYALKLRKRQVDLYRRLIKDDEAFAVASTLVLGYRADLSKETLAAYSKTGTIHALSVSGAHVGIIYLCLNWLFFFLNRFKIWKLIIICSIIWYYSLLTGFSPSVLRSAVMLSIYLIAKTFDKNTNGYNILAFTAFCLLIYSPFLIWDVGFQLSFLAVFGLIYLQPKIYNLLFFKQKIIDRLWSTVAISVAAQFATFPLSIYYFHQFPVYFIVSNLFILLPLSAMMYLGLLILVLKMYFLAPIFEAVIIFTNKGLNSIADLPFSGITAIWIDRWQLGLLTLALAALTLALVRYSKGILFMALSLLILFQSWAFFECIKATRQRQILFLSLRKHYSAAYISGNQAVLVTDLEPSDPEFEFSVKPALDRLKIKKLSFVTWEMDTTIGCFAKKHNQISFYKVRMLLLDQRFNRHQILGFPKFNLVWLHGNPAKRLKELRKEVLFSSLVIDATNRDFAVDNYKAQANEIAVEHHILKKNTSYLIDLNRLNND